MINNRGFDEGDFGTPERDYEGSSPGARSYDRLTEHCQAVGRESWGYREDEDYYTGRYLMQSIDRALAKGANYLLNVGPRSDGRIPPESERLLRRIGAWHRTVRESFAGTEPASYLTDNEDVLLTRRGDTLYVHLYREPRTARVLLRPINTMPREATLLNTGEPAEAHVEFIPSQFLERGNRMPYLRLRNVPVDAHQDSVLVIRLRFDDLPATAGSRA